MQPLCSTNSVEEGQSKGFQLDDTSLLVVRKHNVFYVYINRCPHLGVPLEWQADQFLDAEGCLIVCATHGALFLIESGECVSGPCKGQSLEAIEHTERDGQIWVQL